MEITEQIVHLHGKDSFVPQNAKTAYRVQNGTILIYIIPWNDGKGGRPLFLCEVEEGGVIPSFVYKDTDYQEWRFSFVAKESAKMKIMADSVTSVLLRKFSKKIALKNYDEEGFENGLVEFYRAEIVKDDIFIKRGEKNDPAAQNAAHGAVKNIFDKDELLHITGKNNIYKAFAAACHFFGQTIPSYDQMKKTLGKEIDIMSFASAIGVICRMVILDEDWYKQDGGVIISTIEDDFVTLLPCGRGKYYIYYTATGKKEKLTKEIAQKVYQIGFSISKTLPNKKITLQELGFFVNKSFSKEDMRAVLLFSLCVALVGILLPSLNQKIYDEYIPLGNLSQLIQFCCLITSFMLGNLFFTIVKELAEFRFKSKIGYELQDAVCHRVFHLPETFFRDYGSGDLAERISMVGPLADQYVDFLLLTSISTLFSCFYLIRMFTYSGKLTGICIIMIAAYVLFVYVLYRNTIPYEEKIAKYRGEASSKLKEYIDGIEKIRMAGAEEQAVYQYTIPFAKTQENEIKKNRFSAMAVSFDGIIFTIFSMVLYYAIVNWKIDVSVGSFMGFTTALGAFVNAILTLVKDIMKAYQLQPEYDRIKPILETIPEDTENSVNPGKLEGSIDIDHVSFSYGPDLPVVLDDVNIHIKKGEYVAIVGESGCGKSTLFKLLLGFEEPTTGGIFYDGKSITTMDKTSLRRNLGVVLQNGKLIAGSVYENITVTAPNATMDQVLAVVQAVGLAEDIRRMPMGLNTIIDQNANTISGGQAQRILIARAIIRNPAILLFDEATSALDNITQAIVCESLESLNITRVVIAHRLSTIQTCNRIIVLSDGKIAEEGNYESLMKKRGLFYRFASRQIAE